MEKYHKSDVCPIEKENERDENYKADNPQIDSERTLNNFHTVIRDESYTEYINQRLKENDLKPRKDAVLMCSFVIGSDGEFFKSLTETEERKFFYDATAYFTEKYGKDNIISAVVHKDETTPHLHLNLIPIDNNRLCAKDLFCPKNLRILQTELYEKAGKKYGLEHGKENSQAKHLSTAEFKAKKIIEQAEEIRRQEQNYADALRTAENGEFTKDRNKLKEQVIALVAENKGLNRRLEISMKETLQFANENRELRKDNERKTQGHRIAVALQKQNPREFDRIVYGKPIGKNLDGFFASVLSMFTPEITGTSRRLKEIEEEIEDERNRQNRLNGNYFSK